MPSALLALTIPLTGVITATTSPAAAYASNISSGFNHANIISDEVFYNGNGMNAAEVQNFLNSKVPNCIIGTPGKEAGSAYKKTQIASNCLRDFGMTTSNMPAGAYCNAYYGAPYETAAQIIAKVGQACGINPKVLLVMLQKEQSLITDTWPTVRQYNYAMGWACPDNGPNHSANCDPSAANFFTQVYRSAWQLKRYLHNPNDYRYRVGVMNTVQWHPNPSCGTSQFVIENNATAALYIYTPYRPNAAALNAGWGEGDNCSSYGNRNFYNYWKQWFGTAGLGVLQSAQATFKLHGAIGAAWHNAGGPNSRYGTPTSAEYVISNATIRQFERGAAVWTAATGAYFVTGGIRNLYLANNGVTGPLGVPISNEYETGFGWEQKFQNGVIKFFRNGTHNIELNESSEPWRAFLKGAIKESWTKAGGIQSRLGKPLGHEYNLGNGIVAQNYTNGTAFWSAQTGAYFTINGMNQAYVKSGHVNSRLGLPISNEYETGFGWEQKFQNGVIKFFRNGTHNIELNESSEPWRAFLKGAIKESWTKAGGIQSRLGKPLGHEYNLGNGIVAQNYTNGTAFWSAQTGAYFTINGMNQAYVKSGHVNSRLGLPISNEYETGFGWEQKFQNGVIKFFRNGTHNIELNESSEPWRAFLKGAIKESWTKAGGTQSRLGKPLGHEYNLGNGIVAQNYTNGTAFWSAQTGAYFTINGMNQAYVKSGHVNSRLGLPISNEYETGFGWEQKFQNGVIKFFRNGTHNIEIHN